MLGLLALLMVALPSALYFQKTLDEVSAATMSARGGGPVVALNCVVQLSQTHRGLSVSMLNGNETLAARRSVRPATSRHWASPRWAKRSRRWTR